MAQYIDKSALVAEIDRRILEDYNTDEEMDEVAQAVLASLKLYICTFKAKEANLEKEFNDFLDNVEGVPRMWHSDEQIEWAKDIARHFYEIGLFSQLTWQDIRLISEIGEDFMNSEESDNLSDGEYYTAILNKLKNEGRDCKTSRQWIRDISKAQKGE